MSVIEPLHVAQINGQRLRFFRAPHGSPDLPWHVLDDLMAVCGFDRGQRRHFLRMTQSDWGTKLSSVASSSGPVTLAPHFVAQGLIGAAVEIGRAPHQTYATYTTAGIAALDCITGGMPEVMAMDYVMAAARNGVIGGDR